MSIYGELIQKARANEVERETSKNTDTPTTLSIKKIKLPPEQPRKYFDPSKMDELVASIETDGILEPLIVRPISKSFYELVAGERRLRASQQLGLTNIPVVIHHLTDAQAQRVALVENLQRENLNPVEEVEAILKLISLNLSHALDDDFSEHNVVSLLYRMQNEQKGKVTHKVMGSSTGDIVEDIFKQLGISWKSFVSNKLSVLKWPEDVLDSAREGKIAFENAKAICRIKDPEIRASILQEAITESLSVANLKAKVKDIGASTQSNSRKVRKSPKEALRSKTTKTLQKLTSKKMWEHVAADATKSTRLKELLKEIELLMK